MSERERYHENAPGHFYVEADLCIQCGNGPAAAPSLVKMNDNHCYFEKQPSTENEVNQAIEAVNACCCGAYRYDGDRPDVIARLSEDDCDKPHQTGETREAQSEGHS
jgi:ferredoxin